MSGRSKTAITMKRNNFTFYSHFEGDMTDFEQFFESKPDLRIECSCGAILELRGEQAVDSILGRDWKARHVGPGHKQKEIL